ncbi:glycoside hydrolase family 16 protein [Dactylonectria estremocensis]|uniref:Glycoside hydrolase family 16 protein n=1 Tax=Dactylonectria estremocensis TaxID=1079267 RepID=A0A9P9EKX5_9HYPO|nr:glycoside hydrolase family 16 protein [Dactylonectria estremocensis]
MFVRFASLCLLLSTAYASIPHLPGYETIFSDDFNGAQGNGVDKSKWGQVRSRSDANPQQIVIYTDRERNAHLSGDGQLYIVPKKGTISSGMFWTTARLESKASWTCGAGKAMILQSEIRVPDFAGSPLKYNGIWPTFWATGQQCREGITHWSCGAWDIFNAVNKKGNRNKAALHFDNSNGKPNNAFSRNAYFQGGAYHTWALKVDRRNTDWKKESLIWYMDGKEFYRVTGAMVGTLNEWKILAQTPYYAIFDLALGVNAGSFAGLVTSKTADGFEGSMRVKYFAVYKSI